ncbi:glycosyltransferase family 4 protein [Bacillus sp. 165]|uniref:glycosyltransferase family 4 protein n=1 Tax=Bacillus sp. 165 TaxID=1529117 RepID=UPI001AD97610|nr:glycosyltransferase family 4 protein [Bacillus sp. 165]MBO9130024.1 glycosyltransferase family 4 protein [Bacillus sp. 165]
MRVAFYNHTSEISGAEISLLLTAKNLSLTTPIIFAPEGELLDQAKELQIEVVNIKSFRARLTKNPIHLLKNIFGLLYGGWKFSRSARKSHIDIIHANSLRAGIMASIFKWYHKIPVIWHVRDIPPKGIIGNLIILLGQLTIKALIGISEPVINGLKNDSLISRLYLVHNGVEVVRKDVEEKTTLRQKLRKEFSTPLNSKVVVIIGQIAPWKRQEDAILAIKKVIDSGENVYLWVVGEAKFREENILYKKKLLELVKVLNLEGRVHFTGFRNDVVDICCASDILLLCSDNEPFGRVVIEGMSQEIPVIATNAGGVPEIINDKVNGLLYEVGDVRSLSKNIVTLLHDNKKKEEIIVNALSSVENSFTIQGTARKVEEIYRIITAK